MLSSVSALPDYLIAELALWKICIALLDIKIVLGELLAINIKSLC